MNDSLYHKQEWILNFLWFSYATTYHFPCHQNAPWIWLLNHHQAFVQFLHNLKGHEYMNKEMCKGSLICNVGIVKCINVLWMINFTVQTQNWMEQNADSRSMHLVRGLQDVECTGDNTLMRNRCFSLKHEIKIESIQHKYEEWQKNCDKPIAKQSVKLGWPIPTLVHSIKTDPLPLSVDTGLSALRALIAQRYCTGSVWNRGSSCIICCLVDAQ